MMNAAIKGVSHNDEADATEVAQEGSKGRRIRGMRL